MPDNRWTAELKTTLQVAKARLSVREKKKTEQVAKERYTVADYVRNNKIPRARIAVEHLVREDYRIEAFERVEAYVDTLIMRMQLIKDRPKNGSVDPAVEQPLCNILWAAPFLSQDIPEFIQVTQIFRKHFGIEYVTMCEQNKLGMVDVDLLRCLSCDLIPKLLIEKYLVEICRSQNVPFEPDQTVMAQDEFWTLGQRYVQEAAVPDDKRPPVLPPPPPSSSNGGNTGGFGGGGGGGHLEYPTVPVGQPSAPTFDKPYQYYQGPQPRYPNINFAPSLPQPPPPAAPSSSNIPRFGLAGAVPLPPPPPRDPFPAVPSSNEQQFPPSSSSAQGGSEDPGFDDLARRFAELRSRK